jgi:nucleoside-diphosphate-sugar epimerase
MNQTFNASRGRGRTILEAAELVKYNLDIDCKIWTKSADPFYPNRDTLNSRKLKRATGWNPQTDIEEGIKSYIEYFSLVNSL